MVTQLWGWAHIRIHTLMDILEVLIRDCRPPSVSLLTAIRMAILWTTVFLHFPKE